MNGKRLLAAIIITLFIEAVMSISGFVVSAAEEPQFILEVEDTTVDVDAYTTLKIHMVNAKGATIKEFVGTNWFYMPYEGVSKTTKNINGKMSFVETEIYNIYPYYGGKFNFWVLVEFEGKTYMTNKVELTVIDESIDDGGQYQNTFLSASVSDNEVYIGQKTVLIYQLYSIYEFTSCFFVDNLQIKDILYTGTPEEKLRTETVIQDGNEYNRRDVEISYLTPIKPGIFAIPARDCYGYISEKEQLPDNKYSIRAFTEPQELIVKPLPSKNQPSDFSWIIGKLNIDAQYSTPDSGDGDMIRLVVKASGDCNMDSLNKIFINDPPGFTVFETGKKGTESFENNKYYAEKEFEITLIPKENGTLTIDPIYISYFDPESASYKKAEIPGVTVTVDGADKIIQAGSERSSSNQTGGNQTGGAQEGNDQADSHIVETIRIEQISYAPQNEGFWVLRISKTLVLVLVIVLPLLGGAAFFLLKRPVRRDEQLNDIYAQLLKSKDENEIYNHFNSMIRHCFGLSLKASSRSEIAEGIKDKRFVTPILDVVEHIEKDKFVPGEVDNELLRKIKAIYKMLNQRQNKSS